MDDMVLDSHSFDSHAKDTRALSLSLMMSEGPQIINLNDQDLDANVTNLKLKSMDADSKSQNALKSTN